SSFCWIELKEAAHCGIVAENCCCVDVAACDLGMRGQDRLGALQGAMPDTGLDKRRPWIVDVAHVSRPGVLPLPTGTWNSRHGAGDYPLHPNSYSRQGRHSRRRSFSPWAVQSAY